MKGIAADPDEREKGQRLNSFCKVENSQKAVAIGEKDSRLVSTIFGFVQGLPKRKILLGPSISPQVETCKYSLSCPEIITPLSTGVR